MMGFVDIVGDDVFLILILSDGTENQYTDVRKRDLRPVVFLFFLGHSLNLFFLTYKHQIIRKENENFWSLLHTQKVIRMLF